MTKEMRDDVCGYVKNDDARKAERDGRERSWKAVKERAEVEAG